MLIAVFLPGEIKPNCEFQRICSGKDKVNKAVVTCYDDSCTAIQNGQPIRMCFSCHSKQHKELNNPTHIYQGTRTSYRQMIANTYSKTIEGFVCP